MGLFYLLSLLTFLVAMTTVAQCTFTITSYSSGEYTIAVNNVTWLGSAPQFLYANGKKYNTSDGSLTTDKVSYSSSGIDKLGPWQDSRNVLRADDIVLNSAMKTYQTDQLPLIIFTQTFLNETKGMKSPGANQTTSSFPGFNVTDLHETVGYLSFGGEMVGDVNKKLGRWGPDTFDINDGLGGGPLVMFDKHGNTVIMQAFSNFMSTSLWYDNSTRTINWGVMGDVDSVPAGYQTTVVLYYTDQGINKAFEDLGSRIRYYYDKTDYYKKLDNTLNYLGYWTDNGAYYYYHTERNNTATYQETMIDVNSYSDMEKIPYKYMQLDSWWYKKGALNGVTEWSPMPNIFPNGLKFLHNKTGLPFAAHNRYWSQNATYAKQNGGKYNFIIGDKIALPDDQEFWNFLLSQAKAWGLIMYEQDWLNAQLIGLEALQNDLTLGQRWLTQMGQAAQDNEMTIQYCMALPREALQSLTIPSVTQARVSDDYHLQTDQWKIGVTSLFAYSLGLSPSKDTFWTTENQTGNPYDGDCKKAKTPGDVSKCGDGYEPYPSLQTVVAVLSTGPVGPGDMINGTDREMLMRCCNEDGLILKPSKPATAIDDQIVEEAFQDGSGPDGEIWTTYSEYPNLNMRFGVILVANTSRPYTITRRTADIIPFVDKYPAVVFSADDTSNVTVLDDQHPFTLASCSLDDNPGGCLYYTSPVMTLGATEVIIFGDLNKIVPMSQQRIYKIWVTKDAVALTLRGKPGETIKTSYMINGSIHDRSRDATAGGCASIILYEEQGSTFQFPPGMKCEWDVTTTAAPPTVTSTTPMSTASTMTSQTSATTKATMKPSSPKPTSGASKLSGLFCTFFIVAFNVILRTERF